METFLDVIQQRLDIPGTNSTKSVVPPSLLHSGLGGCFNEPCGVCFVRNVSSVTQLNYPDAGDTCMANRFELMTNTHDHFKFVIRDLENENDDNEIAWMQTEKDAALIHRALIWYEIALDNIAKTIKGKWEDGESHMDTWRQETTSLTQKEKEKVWRKLFPDAAQ